jgi:hypothetical protein
MLYTIHLGWPRMPRLQDTIFDLFNKRAKVEMMSGGGNGLRFAGLRDLPVSRHSTS